jgi:hypothetical protein
VDKFKIIALNIYKNVFNIYKNVFNVLKIVHNNLKIVHNIYKNVLDEGKNFMSKNADWYPQKLAEQDDMYRNVAAKIDGYKAKYNLSDEFIAEVKLICATFGAAYQSLMQIRATKKQMEAWFADILLNKQKNTLVTTVPSFQTISLPVGAFVGIKKRFRKLMGLIKSQTNYTQADGKDLMIVAPQEEALNLTESAPRLKIGRDASGELIFSYKRGRFGGIEIQWRRVGENVWQFGEKSTETKVEFAPPLAVSGVP